MIVAIIPAHNEQGGIKATIESLSPQVDRIVVSADNCTDQTGPISWAAGAEVFTTFRNKDKKAGALNQVLSLELPNMADDDLVLVVDADTVLAHNFVSIALDILNRKPNVAAVGGVFSGDNPQGLLQLLQAHEYERYAREIDRTGRTMVLSGTAALIRVSVLKEIAAARGGTLPGRTGDIYDSSALTEDMELGLAIRTLGYELKSPVACSCTTELMPTLKALHNQRVRWYRGALENLLTYGFTKVTARYWRQQIMLSLVTIIFALYLIFTVWVVGTGQFGFSPFWTAVGGVFIFERVFTVWRLGWKSRGIALIMVVELLYDLFLQAAFIVAVWKTVRRSQHAWHHLEGK